MGSYSLFNGDATSDFESRTMRLDYHPDTQSSSMQKLYCEIDDEIENRNIQSRRAIAFNLPPDTTSAQVLQSLAVGQVISVSVIPQSLSIGPDNTLSAVIEFHESGQAQKYLDSIQADPPICKSANGQEYEVGAWLIPSPSFPLPKSQKHWTDMGLTRTLMIGNIPASAVWFVVSAMSAMAELANVTYSADDQSMTVQFTSLNTSIWFYRLFRDGLFDFIPENDSVCHCEPILDAVAATPEWLIFLPNAIDHIPKDLWSQEYNKPPYNMYWPTSYFYIMSLCGLEPKLDSFVSPAVGGEDHEANSDADSPSNQSEKLSIQYRIVGSTIKLTRHKHSWSISDDDNRKLLMANTLHDPEWAKLWDEYFSSNKLINIRTWEEYGAIARHRREVATALGLAEGMVAVCSSQCDKGCTDLRHVPPADVVKTYFADFYVDNMGYDELNAILA
ncbi:hypothetical protein K4F52_001575 [Lecanicillium sp. MT-2017a]|nr:hypothetical protein K4F52_001575 [Lecanicillium sp. MT-2017a]